MNEGMNIDQLMEDLFPTVKETGTSISPDEIVEEVILQDFTKYRTDLVGFCRDVLGMEPWAGANGEPGQLEVLQAIQESARRQLEGDDDAPYIIRVEAGHGIGKCVYYTDWITLADGTRVQAFELADKDFHLLTLVNGEPQKVRAFARFNAVETVYRIVTETGKVITRNGEHPLWVGDITGSQVLNGGWVNAENLVVGQVVAIAESLPAFSDSTLSDDEVKFAAYMIAKGIHTTNTLVFAQEDGPILDEMWRIMRSMDCQLIQTRPVTYRIAKAQKDISSNKANDLARRLGMWKIYSEQKRVPSEIFKASAEQTALFLGCLYDCAGWFSNEPTGQIEYATLSEQLAQDIIYLLQKLGIHAHLRYESQDDYYIVSITDALEQIKFHETIPLLVKGDLLKKVIESSRDSNDGTPLKLSGAHPGTRWEQIEKIEVIKNQATIAITVPDHETFLTQFYEHNTYGIEAPAIIWFYEVFRPSVIHSTANTADQVRDLLWKDIRTHVANAAKLGFRVFQGLAPKETRAELAANHFATGFTTSDSGGTGSERAQGQHNPYHMYVFDEADGIPSYMFGAVKRMLTGNTVRLWLMIANPKRTNSSFALMKGQPGVIDFRLSALNFPNVVYGKEIVPNGTKRSTIQAWISDLEEFGAEVVDKMDESKHTFTLGFDIVYQDNEILPAGTIFKPLRGFLYGAMGIPPEVGFGDTFITMARYEACVKREPKVDLLSIRRAQIGIDCARYGDDSGKIYLLHRRVLTLSGSVQGSEESSKTITAQYVEIAVEAAKAAHANGARWLSVRVDGGGGYGGGIIDTLRIRADLKELFTDGFIVHEVNNRSVPNDPNTFSNLVTEMYASVDEVMKVIKFHKVGKNLMRDLTTRKFGYVTRNDRDVKEIEGKPKFKQRNSGQSPDDGDGAVLAMAPERLFKNVAPPLKSGETLEILRRTMRGRR